MEPKEPGLAPVLGQEQMGWRVATIDLAFHSRGRRSAIPPSVLGGGRGGGGLIGNVSYTFWRNMRWLPSIPIYPYHSLPMFEEEEKASERTQTDVSFASSSCPVSAAPSETS